MTLHYFLVLSAVLFSIGVYGALTRRNILGILMSIELMFNAANINLVAFNHYLHPGNVWGQGFVIFVITVAAAEVAVGLALIVALYRKRQTAQVEDLTLMKL